MTFARRMGLDAQQVWDMFAPSPIIGTGVYRLRGEFVVDRKPPRTMKVEVWQKDMQVIGDMARAVDCPVPLFSPACRSIAAAARRGWRRTTRPRYAGARLRMTGGGKEQRRGAAGARG